MKIGLTAKLSKIEWDMYRLGLTYNEVLKKFDKQSMDVDKIIKSHVRQNKCIDEIVKAIPEAININLLSKDELAYDDFDVMIVIGGDNFFQMASHHFQNSIIVGVNSDTVTSYGGLLNFDYNSLLSNIDSIKSGNLNVDDWTRVSVMLNNNRVEDAICTASLSIKATDMISRYMLSYSMIGDTEKAQHYNKSSRKEEQKCTGLLVVSGAGSGQNAWYRNEGLYLPMIKSMNFKVPTREFSKTAREIRTLTRGALGGEDCNYKYLNMRIPEGKQLDLIYWSNNPSELSIDSIFRYEVHEGDRLRFSLSDTTLKVARP
jgi:NAD kinase